MDNDPRNVNAVSGATRELILDKQIEYVLKEDLDDFKELTIDSTAVKANSSWPTDGKILIALLGRAHRLGQKLHDFALEDFKKGCIPRWLDKMDKLEFQICLNAGKANSRGKMKKHYRVLLRLGRKTIDSLTPQLSKLEKNLKMEALPPSRREILTELLHRGEQLELF